MTRQESTQSGRPKPITAMDVWREAVFTLIEDDTGKQTHFAVDRMIAWCTAAKLPVAAVAVDPQFAVYCVENRGVEFERLAQITFHHLTEPLIFCRQPDGSHLLVDGHHRYVKAAQLAISYVRAYLLEPEQWEPFLIQGMPTVRKQDLMTHGLGEVIAISCTTPPARSSVR